MKLLRLLVALPLIGGLFPGCDWMFGQRQMLDGALAILPLPPNTGEFTIDGKDSTNFSLSAKYSDYTEAELLAFYRDFFTQNGWTLVIEPGEEITGLLEAEKGRNNANITVITVGGEIHLLAIYTEYEHTHDEFAEKVKASVSTEVSALIAQVHETYAGLMSYRDTGTAERINDGRVLGRSQFSTVYRDPGDLLFEHWDSTGDFHFVASVISKIGDDVRYMHDFDAKPESDTIDMAIAAYYGTSGTTSGNIPAMLLGLEDTSLFHLSDMKLLDDAKLEDGTVCHRIQGRDFLDDDTTIWIGKEDRLIRRIESVTDGANRETIHYQPETNLEISDGDLEFRKPVAKKF